MTVSREIDWEAIRQLLAVDTTDFRELARAARLDPASDFRHADLRDVDFEESDLSGFDFTGADLEGAKLDRADVTRARLDSVWLIKLQPAEVAQNAADSRIYLVYSRIDNDRSEDDRLDGWVTYFYNRLRLALQAKLGKRPDFWRDVEEIQEGAVWHEPIKQALAQAKVLLLILSPAFLASENCLFELEFFIDTHKGVDPARLGERVIKVLKDEIDAAQLPAMIREPEAYQFFVPDKLRGNLPYYDPEVGLREDRAQEFLDELNRLANRLAILLREEPAGPAPVATVFVAIPSPESALANAYATIVAELDRRNVKVVPDRKLFYAQLDTPDRIVLEQAVTKSMLAVHLLDPTAGKEALAFDRRQLEATAARARQGTDRLQRLLWLAPKPEDAADNELVQSLRRSETNGGSLLAEDRLIEGALPRFVAILIRKLFSNGDPTAPLVSQVPAGGKEARPVLRVGSPSVYVVGAIDDASLVDEVTATLIDSYGLDAWPCSFDKSPDEFRLHEEAMRQADAVLYCWGKATTLWVMSHIRGIRFPARLGRERPFRVIALLPAPPLEGRKLTFRSADITLYLPPSEAITPELFAPLVVALQ